MSESPPQPPQQVQSVSCTGRVACEVCQGQAELAGSAHCCWQLCSASSEEGIRACPQTVYDACILLTVHLLSLCPPLGGHHSSISIGGENSEVGTG